MSAHNGNGHKNSRQQQAVQDPQITTGNLPRSEKVYVPGTLPGVRVPMRKISQTDSPAAFAMKGKGNSNPPIYVYDCSGPYTDPQANIDIYKGLEPIRKSWIEGRGDVEQLSGHSSEFTNKRAADPKVDAIRFPKIPNPLRAKAGQNVSQMHYARKGIITPEMEFVAIRENQMIDAYNADLLQQHPGRNWGAETPKSHITPNLCAPKWPAAAPSSPTTSTTRKASP
jgi:phosphomethylpyrimidine synthase